MHKFSSIIDKPLKVTASFKTVFSEISTNGGNQTKKNETELKNITATAKERQNK